MREHPKYYVLKFLRLVFITVDSKCIFYPLSLMSWRRKWQPTAVFLPGESHGQRSLVGYSPQGHKESDTTKVTEHASTQTIKSD